jgi:hypothetical protein
MTLEFWVRVDDFPWYFQSILVDAFSLAGLGEPGFRLSLTNTGDFAQNLHYGESTTAGKSKGFYAKSPVFNGLAEGLWYHVAIVRTPIDEGSAKVNAFINGKYVMGPVMTELNEDPSNGDPIFIGCSDKDNGVGAHFIGAIDEFRLSSVARYDGNFEPSQVFDADQETVILFHFDTEGEVVEDASANGLNGEWIGEGDLTGPPDALVCQ